MIDAEVGEILLERVACILATVVRSDHLHFIFGKSLDLCHPLLEEPRCMGLRSKEAYPGIPRVIVLKHHHITYRAPPIESNPMGPHGVYVNEIKEL